MSGNTARQALMAVTRERRDRVLVITIEREQKRNALNAEMTQGLDEAMNELEDTPELWCGIPYRRPAVLLGRR
jgi:enoyl-CoA hydratase/carnithine racemase